MVAKARNDLPLAGRVALVTGAGGGLGGVMLRALAAHGAQPVAIDMKHDPQLQQDLADAGLLSLKVDISDEQACRSAIETVAQRFGDVAILVNCAGITGEQPATGAFPRFWERDPANWRQVQRVNHDGTFHMAYHSVRPMIARGWGRIINITTSFATMIAPGMAAYGPSKSAMEASSAIWAKELEGTGVTVNVLIPGGPVAGAFVPASLPKELQLDPAIMSAPVQWMASAASDGITGRRFTASQWDDSLPPAEAAQRCSALAAWLSGPSDWNFGGR